MPVELCLGLGASVANEVSKHSDKSRARLRAINLTTSTRVSLNTSNVYVAPTSHLAKVELPRRIIEVTMNGALRSKQGCWTCRLRKKKCDEKHPFCSTCESLTITCYGYGSKPDWMDNGEKEREIAHAIKQVVKHTSRRKGRLGSSITQLQKRYGSKKIEPSVVKIAPKATGASSSSSSPGSNLDPYPPTGENSSSTHATPNASSSSPDVRIK